MMKFNGKVMKFGNYWGTYGSVTPPGPVIEEVTIGSYTWTANNIAIDDGEGGIYTRNVTYGQGEVVEYYYTWDAARRIANKVDGWHLPTHMEMWYLKADAGQDTAVLRSTYGWTNGNGTNSTGFNIFPAGYIYTSDVSFNHKGLFAYLWSDRYDSSIASAERMYIGATNVGMDTGWVEPNLYAYSLRLVKDAT